MRPGRGRSASGSAIRPPAVAGSFYPAEPDRLAALVHYLLAQAQRLAAGTSVPGGSRPPSLRGILVPHAGLVYSGLVAAVGWRRLRDGRGADQRADEGAGSPTVVVLGTNHGAGWLDGVGVWPSGAWRTPLGDVAVDGRLAAAILGLGRPFVPDSEAHLGEHSIEVQLPLLQGVAASARIVPLAVSAGTGPPAVEAGRALGALLAAERARGNEVVLVISSDMAHYPARTACAEATAHLLPLIERIAPHELAREERRLRRAGIPGFVCGMCGIEPAVLGLGALEAMGATGGRALHAATSADAGGSADRTVGYLSVAFG